MTAARRPGTSAAVARGVVAGLLAIVYSVIGIVATSTVGKVTDPDYVTWAEVTFAVTAAAHTVLLVVVCVLNAGPLMRRSMPDPLAARRAFVAAISVAWLDLVALVVAALVSPASDALPVAGLLVTAPVGVLAWLTWRSARP